jgi:hypothetical protein
MIDHGVLGEDDSIELLDGRCCREGAQSSPHTPNRPPARWLKALEQGSFGKRVVTLQPTDERASSAPRKNT